jgi:hypothetical protein
VSYLNSEINTGVQLIFSVWRRSEELKKERDRIDRAIAALDDVNVCILHGALFHSAALEDRGPPISVQNVVERK